MATIDHLDNRLSEDRGKYAHSNEPRTVLACRQCNNKRGWQDLKIHKSQTKDGSNGKHDDNFRAVD